jgi:hypothetical protein
MSERRTEIIVRLPNLRGDGVERVVAVLAPLVRRLGGRMSAIERDHFDDHAVHVSRRRIV